MALILWFKRACREVQGSVTVEAAIIFPVIILLLLGLVILAAYIYQRYGLFETTVYVAAQRAATWDNSSKDLETGALKPPVGQDNLYWRLFEDHQGAALTQKKLDAAVSLAERMSAAALFSSGRDLPVVSYRNIPGLQRQVTVKTGQKSLATGNLFQGLLPRRVTSAVTSQVAEPAEFIRNVELIATQGKQRMVVSSVNSRLYHYPECPRSYDNRIKDKNFELFYTEEEAIKAGKIRSCLYCQRLK
ncbi:MAG TPA: TadE/TadG family type IV pilus assembly protein [Bacillota bacterium]|nr:TadE/TadG family type IV pilus assembly protein [Bacillota bacterium]